MAPRSRSMDAVSGGTQWAVSVLGGLYVGHRFDRRWGTDPWLLLLGGALGLGLGMYVFLRPFFTKE